MSEFQIEVHGLDAVLARIPDAAKRRVVQDRMLRRIASAYEAELKKAYLAAGIKNRTGHGLDSIGVDVSLSPDEVSVKGGAKYLKWLDEGTGLYGPHHTVITSPTGKVMRWAAEGSGRATGAGGGDFVFARSVKGMKPRPFFMKGVELGDVQAKLIRDKAAAELTELGV